MKKYFYLQLKRALKILPFVLTVSMALLLGVIILLSSVVTSLIDEEKNEIQYIGITGDIDNEFVSWGISAVETLDDTRFSVKFVTLSEEDAQEKLGDGDLCAYVILPQNFVNNALNGKIDPITFVTSTGDNSIVTMFKNEVTKLITDVLIYSQKGTYGVGDALSDNGHSDKASQYINKMSIEYVDLILNRNKIYTVNELGIKDKTSLVEYFICGLTILLIMLISLPFVTIYTRKDNSLNKLLISRGFSGPKLLQCEFFAHVISMLIITGLIISTIFILLLFAPQDISHIISTERMISFSVYLMPVVVMICSFNILFFELSDNVVSAVLLHFFVSISLCYIGGCLYPISTFPQILQTISLFLPTSIARGLLYDSMNSYFPITNLALTVAYTIAFFFLTLAVRTQKTAAKRR